MKSNQLLSVVTITIACGAIGCAPTTPKLPESQVVRMVVKKPALAPLPETKPTQERGGLTLVVEPLMYDVRNDSIVADQPRKPDFLEPLTAGEGATFFERTVTPTATIIPDRLGFNVRLINGLNHVVRGAGTVLSFVVDARQVAPQQEGYADLVNAVVIPRGEVAVKIWGPSLSSLPDSCTFGLFLYDFVTATDAAGNPTERQNFEWYYKYIAIPSYVNGHKRVTKMVRTPKR